MTHHTVHLWLAVCLLFGAGTAFADQQVVLRLVDQDGQEIAGSQIGVNSETYPTGASVTLAEGDHLFRLYPSCGGAGSGYALHRGEYREVTSTTESLEFEWITAEVTIHMVDQFNVELSGGVFRAGYPSAWYETGTTLVLPVNDPAVYDGLTGIFAGGYQVLISPPTPDANNGYALSRSVERVVLPVEGTSVDYEWIMADATVRVVDQDGEPIPGGAFLMGYSQGWFESGVTLRLPVNDPDVYDGLTGIFAGGYHVRVSPGTPDRNNGYALGREVEPLVLAPGGTTTDHEWIMADVTFRVVDQDGGEIPGSSILVGYSHAWYETGTTLRLPVDDSDVYAGLTGSLANGYPIKVSPGIGGRTTRAYILGRTEQRVLSPTTSVLEFEWLQQSCRLHLVDAAGEEVPGSTLVLPTWFPPFTSGDFVTFPVNDSTRYENMEGVYLDNYSIQVAPGDLDGVEETFQFKMTAEDGLVPAPFEIGGNEYSLRCGNYDPVVEASGDGTYEIGADNSVTLGALVDDEDGDALVCRWFSGDAPLADAETIDTDPASGPVALTDVAVPTLDLGVGAHLLRLEVTDGRATISTTVEVTVVDTTDPVLTAECDTTTLWPPNHKMVDVTVKFAVADNAGTSPDISVEVGSDEVDDNPLGPDWDSVVVDAESGKISLRLRAERNGGGDGRTYTISITATDAAGNATVATATVVVPHDQRGH